MTVGVRMADRVPWRSAAWQRAVELRRTLWGTPTASLRARPDFLLIGTQRGGTTSLYRYLESHPDVRWPALVKGPHWFDVHYDESARWYRSYFPLVSPVGGERTWQTGEACPYYLFHPAVPKRVAAHLPDVRLVAVIREPVSRAWSHYQHERQRGFEELGFEDALDAEEERLEPELPQLHRPDFVGHHHRHHSYASRGMYAEQIRRYHHHLPPEQLLILTSDELRHDTQGSFDRVCDFLGLPHHELGVVPAHNARAYASMDEDLRERLRDHVAGPNAELQELLGEPLDGWS